MLKNPLMTPESIAEYLDSQRSEHTGFNEQFPSRTALLQWLMDEPINYRIRICEHLNAESTVNTSFIPALLCDLPKDHHLDINMVEKVLIAIIDAQYMDSKHLWKERNKRLAVNLLDGFKNRHGVDVVSRPFHSALISHIPPDVVDSIGRAVSKIDPKRMIDNAQMLRLADTFWSNAKWFTAETMSSFLRLLDKDKQIRLLDDCLSLGHIASYYSREITDDRPNSEKWYLNAFTEVMGDDVVRERITDTLFYLNSELYISCTIIDQIGGDDFLCNAIKRAIDENDYSKSFIRTLRELLDLPCDEIAVKYPKSLAYIGKGDLFQKCFAVDIMYSRMTYDNICKTGAVYCKDKLISELDSASEKEWKATAGASPSNRSQRLSSAIKNENVAVLSIIKAIGPKEFSEMAGTISREALPVLRALFPDVSTREFATIFKGSKHHLLADDLGL